MSQTRISDAALDATLRRLDAEPATPLDDITRVRSAAALERTLVVGRLPDERAALWRDPLVPRPRRTGVRVALLGAAAAAVAVGIGVTQVLGGGSGTAYADSWEPVPVPASAADTAAAREACADSEKTTTDDGGEALQVQLAERRGDLVLLAMDDGTAQPASLMCMVAVPGRGEAEWLGSAGGGGSSRPPADAVAPPALSEQGAPDALSAIDGLAGDRVAGVTVHTAEGLSVEATVENGHYVAWWPGSATRYERGVPEGRGWGCSGDCDRGQPVDSFTLDVTLDDGTVLRNATPRF